MAGFNTEPVSRAEFQARQAADMTEAELQLGVETLAKRLGWLSYHTHDSRRSQPGFPDCTLVHPRRHVSMFRELKTMKGKLTPDQRIWLEALAAAGHDVGVWRPIDFIDGTIRRALEPPEESRR